MNLDKKRILTLMFFVCLYNYATQSCIEMAQAVASNFDDLMGKIQPLNGEVEQPQAKEPVIDIFTDRKGSEIRETTVVRGISESYLGKIETAFDTVISPYYTFRQRNDIEFKLKCVKHKTNTVFNVFMVRDFLIPKQHSMTWLKNSISRQIFKSLAIDIRIRFYQKVFEELIAFNNFQRLDVNCISAEDLFIKGEKNEKITALEPQTLREVGDVKPLLYPNFARSCYLDSLTKPKNEVTGAASTRELMIKLGSLIMQVECDSAEIKSFSDNIFNQAEPIDETTPDPDRFKCPASEDKSQTQLDDAIINVLLHIQKSLDNPGIKLIEAKGNEDIREKIEPLRIPSQHDSIARELLRPLGPGNNNLFSRRPNFQREDPPFEKIGFNQNTFDTNFGDQNPGLDHRSFKKDTYEIQGPNHPNSILHNQFSNSRKEDVEKTFTSNTRPLKKFVGSNQKIVPIDTNQTHLPSTNSSQENNSKKKTSTSYFCGIFGSNKQSKELI